MVHSTHYVSCQSCRLIKLGRGGVLGQGRAAVNEDGSLYWQHAKINTPNK